MSNIKKEKIVPAKISSKIISEFSQETEETKDVSRHSVGVFISKKHVVIRMIQKGSVIQTDIDYVTKVKQDLPIRLKEDDNLKLKGKSAVFFRGEKIIDES